MEPKSRLCINYSAPLSQELKTISSKSSDVPALVCSDVLFGVACPFHVSAPFAEARNVV